MSNKRKPAFTDAEVMTVYIFGITEGLSEVKQIYKRTGRYRHDWFAQFPSYQAFNERLNKLPFCFEILVLSINCKALQGLVFKKEKVMRLKYPFLSANKHSCFSRECTRI